MGYRLTTDQERAEMLVRLAFLVDCRRRGRFMPPPAPDLTDMASLLVKQEYGLVLKNAPCVYIPIGAVEI